MIQTSLTPIQFGIGDGTVKVFALIANATDFSGTPKIFRNAVQAVPVADYVFAADGTVTFVVAPGAGVVLTWAGAVAYTVTPGALDLAHKTIIGQYQNSATLVRLIQDFAGYIDPSANFDQFIKMIWNIDTATAFGLDIIGRILNVSRQINVPAIYPVLVAPGLLSLADEPYRALLRAKALSNISDSSARGINVVLRTLFAGRGNAFSENLGNMHMRYKFLFALQAFEYGIMQQSQAVPQPAGVQTEIFSVQPYFGFTEANSWSTFGEAPFAAY